MKTIKFVITAWFLSLLIVAGCQSYKDGGSRTVGEFTDDVAIQTKVKTRLISDPDVKGWPMNVDVHKGVVTLYGRAGSEALRRKALAIAGGVKGVTRVEDRLTIVTE